MYGVVKITFLNTNRVYFFDSNKLDIQKGDKVIVESEKGIQFGTAFSNNLSVSEDKLIFPLKKVLRKATKNDIKIFENNEKEALEALKKAKGLVKELNLDMKILSAVFNFEKTQLLFNFIADERVDFRELAKKLAYIYKTRIELRQIGVRDKAKEIGAIGPCGRFLCCNSFLNDFESVSINMAKNQYISLKPDKINGICGRLLCCLNYEDDQYTELKKQFPKIGTQINNKNISGKVVSHNLFKETVTIETQDKIYITMSLKEYESNK